MTKRPALPMLLLEPDDLLRRTVALTARSLGLGDIVEAGSATMARRLMAEHRFGGAVIALDVQETFDMQLDLRIIDEVRANHKIPVAVMLASCDGALASTLQARSIDRIILKPFRARTLIDTFAEFYQQPA